MKNITLLVFALICFSSTVIAQSSVNIIFNGYHTKAIEDRVFGNYKYFHDRRQGSMKISATETPSVYSLVYNNVKSTVEMTVEYDKKRTEEIRKSWKDQSINCYKRKDGDYIYMSGGTLKQLLDKSIYWYSSKARMYYVKTKEGRITEFLK